MPKKGKMKSNKNSQNKVTGLLCLDVSNVTVKVGIRYSFIK